MSLCGVLVFRLDPAKLGSVILCPPPSSSKTIITHGGNSQLTHFSFTNFSTYSLFHSYKAILNVHWHSSSLRIYPPRLLQLNHVHCMRKVTTWCHFENGRRSTQNLLKSMRRFNVKKAAVGPRLAFGVAGAVHRASWTCGARGRRWAAATFPVAGAVHRRWTNKIGTSSMFGIYAHWTIHSNTFNIWIKLTCWHILLDLPALSPTKRYV